MKSSTDKLVENYLDRLDEALADLPRSRRRELVQEIEDHIAEARAELDPEDELGVRNLLDRIGDPSEIAAEAVGGRSPELQRARWRDVAALILLPIGGVVVPFLGWVVGVALLWVSDAWSTREKLIGTFVVPGGLLVPLGLMVMGSESSSCIAVRSGGGPTMVRTCTDEGGTNWGLVLLVAVFVLAPIASTAFLARRMRRPVQALP
jgi:uncharacterized membrane protein